MFKFCKYLISLQKKIYKFGNLYFILFKYQLFSLFKMIINALKICVMLYLYIFSKVKIESKNTSNNFPYFQNTFMTCVHFIVIHIGFHFFTGLIYLLKFDVFLKTSQLICQYLVKRISADYSYPCVTLLFIYTTIMKNRLITYSLNYFLFKFK